ncbi:hypothetical protein Bca4012_060649 [Brassica carinata]|uniref:Uncharacterized protein n=1 Tax=Brassica carinata TaxID=52824 RepID=A0A8X7S9W1_BRACI|nr:hypothetical protein Bca52824_030987 [Brassica carinata]
MLAANTCKHLNPRIDTRHTPLQLERLRLESPPEPHHRINTSPDLIIRFNRLPLRWSFNDIVIGHTEFSRRYINGELSLPRSHPIYPLSTRADKNNNQTTNFNL